MPSLAHEGTQYIARDPQLTVEDVKLVCRVTEPCKRQSPGWSPCLGTQGHWAQPSPCSFVLGVVAARGWTPHMALLSCCE